MSEFLTTIFDVLVAALLPSSITAYLLAIELLTYREPPNWINRIRAYLFGAVYVAAKIFFFMVVYSIFRNVGLPTITMPFWLAVLTAFVVYDFCYYWMHRAQHAIPFLWRFHRVHHSIEHMGIGTGYHHVTQIAIEAVCLTLPLSFIAPSGAVALVVTLAGIHGAYLHSTSKLHFGPLAWIIHDNRTHRIHHSMEIGHFDKNFGVPSMIMDRLFETAHMPARDEWPQTGMVDHPEPRSMWEYLIGRRTARLSRDRVPLSLPRDCG